MKKHYKIKEVNKVKLKSYLNNKNKSKKMKELQDNAQVIVANGTAISISLVKINHILTLISLCLAIAFSIYKFVNYDKKKQTKQ